MDKNDRVTRTAPTSPRTRTQAPSRQRIVAAPPPGKREPRGQSTAAYRPPRPGHHPSVVLHALSAATSAALAGLAVCAAMVLIAWAADPRTQASTAGALRAAAQVWLVAHHGSFRLPSGNIGLLPLGMAILPAVLLLRAGTSLARALRLTDLLVAIQATAALAGSYGLFVVIICAAAATTDVGAAPVQTLLGSSLLAFVAGGAGVVRGSALWRRAFLVLTPHARLVIRASGVGAGVLVAVGAIAAGASFAVNAGRAVDLFQALAPGVVDGFALLLLCIAYVPNAALWGTAFAAGPGFAVGAGTHVSVFGVQLGAVPAFPLLAALPEGDRPAIAAFFALLGPLIAGVLIGVFLSRRLETGDYGDVRLRTAAGWAALSGVVAGVALGIGAAFAGGSLGNGRLADVGPSPWRLALFASIELAALASLVASLLHGVRRWKVRKRINKAKKKTLDASENSAPPSDDSAKKPVKQRKRSTDTDENPQPADNASEQQKSAARPDPADDKAQNQASQPSNADSQSAQEQVQDQPVEDQKSADAAKADDAAESAKPELAQPTEAKSDS